MSVHDTPRVAVFVAVPLDGTPVELTAPEGYPVCAGWHPATYGQFEDAQDAQFQPVTAPVNRPGLIVVWEKVR